MPDYCHVHAKEFWWFSTESVIRGHHVYKDVWTPVIGEELICQRETWKSQRSIRSIFSKENHNCWTRASQDIRYLLDVLADKWYH